MKLPKIPTDEKYGPFRPVGFRRNAVVVLRVRRSDGVKTTFQTSREWRPTIDNRADAAMVYGVGGNPSDNSDRIPFEERVRS